MREAVSPATILDVGANTGYWSVGLLKIAKDLGVPVQIHAFEPSRETFTQLSETLGSLPNITLVNQACSRQPGTAVMNVYGSCYGSNSIVAPVDGRVVVAEEKVEITTIDLYCEANRIEKIDFLKIDAEGHDLEVIAGAVKMLDRQAVRILQFEYEHQWIGCRSYLRDVFTLLIPKGYVIGKLVGPRIEFYPYWQWELENWAESNYIACLKSELRHFPHSEPKWLLYDQSVENG